MNKSGKTLTILLVIIAVLLLAVTVISSFFFVKEIELRRTAEKNLADLQVVQAKAQDDLKETKNQLFLYQEKQKESEQKIESLMEDLELEQGLREEVKKENRGLKESLDTETKAKEDLQAQISAAEGKFSSLQSELDSAVTRNKEVEGRRTELEAQYQKLKDKLASMGITEEQALNPSAAGENVQLEKIVVPPVTDPKKGSIVSIDQEANFLIVSYGEKDGMQKGTELSIFRGDEHLGDVRISRVLPEMSAADFIPPLSSQQINKDDRVIIKQ